MDALNTIWSTSEDLPFATNVNEEHILDIVKAMKMNQSLDADTVSKIRQWIRFNSYLNAQEEDPYRTWVATVYSQIEHVLQQEEPEPTGS